ncbi:MAG TPA: PDZ domain-containing protein [Acidobacteria bacterium]|jgi:S1-C subfamily serine protease|nr:PDZ domain-containing protein [Acidobacteriota bacterium]
MRTRLACTLLVAFFVAMGAALAAGAQDADTLYTCTAEDETRALDIGVTVCDAAPTDGLTQRMEADNLQLRSGALITEVTPGGLGQTAGLAAGDVIYRVGGVDVADNVMATARLSLIKSDTDTVVNFLRRGRPYRVKLRQE